MAGSVAIVSIADVKGKLGGIGREGMLFASRFPSTRARGPQAWNSTGYPTGQVGLHDRQTNLSICFLR